MKKTVMVQARTSSTRLPAKSLLPLAGMPLALLTIKRAANQGDDAWLVTSDDPSDDALCAMAQKAGVRVCRGALQDVLARYAQAAEGLGDDEWIVRLTGDNVIPDGSFLALLAEQAIASRQSYFGTESPADGLPYGVSAEMFTVKMLREAEAQARSPHDREHVTPWMKRTAAPSVFRSPLPRDASHLRATIDTLDDYQRMHSVFRSEPDPIDVSWTELCARLQARSIATFRVPFRKKNGRVLSRMTMGTAQLGLARYGAANTRGQPSEEEALDMLRLACAHGVTVVDTAYAYEAAESRIGRASGELSARGIAVVTKLAPLDWLAEDASDELVRNAVEHSVYRSCCRLGQNTLDVVLLHRPEHLHAHRGRIWRALLRCRDEGLVRDVGVSIYHPDQGVEALEHPEVRHVQLPFNMLDARWRESAFMKARLNRPDVTVYARSAFLQGVLVSPPGKWPAVAGSGAATWCAMLDRFVTEFDRESRADLCLAFVTAQPWIDSVVLGMETRDQLLDNLRLIGLPPLTEEQGRMLGAAFGNVPADVINPSRWN